MIHTPFDPRVSTAILALLAQLAIVLAGFAMMLRVTKLAVRLVLLGIFLAVVAGLSPHWIQ